MIDDNFALFHKDFYKNPRISNIFSDIAHVWKVSLAYVINNNTNVVINILDMDRILTFKLFLLAFSVKCD